MFRRSCQSWVVRSAPVVATAIRAATKEPPQCEAPTPSKTTTLLRKRTTLASSLDDNNGTLDQLRRHRTQLLQRWERDEVESWRQLPARAWPAVQPEPDQLPQLQRAYDACVVEHHGTECHVHAFYTATTLVFYGVDPARGLAEFRRLADREGYVDAMVACGVVLVEGLVDGKEDNRNEQEEGVGYLQRAAEEGGSSQAYYELGTLYYTGLEGVVEEDEAKAFACFEKAAAQDHTAALYMMADCLVQGEGTEVDVPRAIPLFYRAAERGHRFARQRIREFLAAGP